MKIEPLHDQVVILRDTIEAKSAGGIVLPGAAQEKPTQGAVVAVGAGRWLDSGKLVAPTLKPGDRVLFGAYAGQDIEVDSKKYLVMSEQDVIARLS